MPPVPDGGVAAFVGRSVTLTWTAAATATGYVVEIGSRTGIADIASVETTQTSLDWTPQATGDVAVQVKAKNAAGTGPAPKGLTIHVQSLHSFIEALFLGSGPYADPNNRGCVSDHMVGWAPGTDIRIKPSTGVPPAQMDGVRNAADQLADATLGLVRAHVEAATSVKPTAAAGEISFSQMVSGSECAAGAAGCSAFSRIDHDVIVAVDMFISPSSVPGPGPHELGHSAYGFCHVLNVSNGQGNVFSYMTVMGFGISGNKMTEADLMAMHAVYGAGLRAGASRSDFVRAGLIDP